VSQPLETYLEKKRKAWIAEHPDKWTILQDTENFQLVRNERTGFLLGINKKERPAGELRSSSK
jgi:hypothetical protein